MLSTTPTSSTSSYLVDDRLLIAHLTGGDLAASGRIATTAAWYFRVAHSAARAAAGHLRGPFQGLTAEDQLTAVEGILAPPADLVLAEPPALLRAMAEVCARHPALNFLNVEATAAALVLGAEVLLSPPAAEGVLPRALDLEGIPWGVRDPVADSREGLDADA